MCVGGHLYRVKSMKRIEEKLTVARLKFTRSDAIIVVAIIVIVHIDFVRIINIIL
jgi:hypothetical protein